ncbi:Probable hemagglutinin-related protein [Cardiobacterium hominis]|uniref:Probable hemagglutinin-related protein n=2 Tax=Cardiobacterium hominis TaxID=2718 RepID=A0A1C3H575_9GAMM|nr:Probable hemagglutinin-related protein [Cardiobacterium hominis]
MVTSAAITGAAEYSVPQLAKLLYGKNIDQLTAAEKNALGQTIGALATGAGAMTGGNSARAYNAGKSAQNAVENNYMASLRDYDKKPKVIQEHTDKLLAAGAMPFEKLDEKYENCNTDKDCQNAVEEEWRKESKKTAILEKELVEKGELELKHLNGYPSIKEQKDESYSSQMVRSANRSKTVLGQREAMSWNSIGKPQEAGEALAIAISRNDDRLGLTERDRERWNVVAASSPGDWMANNKGLATRPLLPPKVEKNPTQIQTSTPKIESVKTDGTSVTTQKIYTDSYGNPIEELVGNGRRGKVTSNAEQASATPNFVLVGKPYLEQSSVIKPGTTVQLNQSQRLTNGEVLPEGSVITTSDNMFKATLPNGTIKKGNVNLIYPQARLNHSIEIGKVIGEYSAIKPGSLNEDMAKTFSGSRYKEVVLDKDTILFRAGTDKIPLGQYFSLEEPLGIMQSRIDKAIPPVWPNGGKSPIDTAFAVKVPAGTKVYIGEVGSQHHAFVGGTQQIIVVKPWEIQGIEIISKRKLK